MDAACVLEKQEACSTSAMRNALEAAVKYYPYITFRPIILGLTKGKKTLQWRRSHY